MASMMAESRPLPTEGPSAGGSEFDDLDDLFNYDVGDENDPFSDNYKLPNKAEPTKEVTTKTGKNDTGLGIDEEVEVSKKMRVPRVKLDEHRLLSAPGIPKLRRKAKDLKFKGKGHEYSDAARLLAFYQLWLDDLFPKARFLDALSMVEKAGHKRQLQTMRMEWINEGRPKSLVHEDSIFDNPSVPLRGDVQQEKEAPRATAPIFERAATGRPNTPVREGNAEMAIDDLYDATPRATRQAQRSTNSHDALSAGRIKGSGYGSARSANEEPHEDELDALLAEEEIMRTEALTAGVVPTASKQAAPPDYPFEDDMEAMADLDGLW